MNKKGLIIFSSLFLLAACDNGETTDPKEEPVPEETIVEGTEGENEVPEPEVEIPAHTYNSLVDETTFTEEPGLQAWEDYKAIIDDVDLGEISIINGEDPNFDELNGTTSEEIQDLVDSIGIREDVFQDEVEVSENEKITFYRYPPVEDSEHTETAQFLAELTFYYADDNLMFSSITPGFYSVEMTDLPSANYLMTLMTVSEIEDLNPKVYTIAEMQINDEKIQQVMTPAMEVNEEGSEELIAFYFFTKDDEIIQYAYLPFEMVSQDFPTNSILLYYQIVPELENL